MKNEQAWNNEYQDSQLVTSDVKPQKDFFRFLEWMEKNNYSKTSIDNCDSIYKRNY